MDLSQAITIAAQKAADDSVTMRRGRWISANVVNLGGATNVRVTAWVGQPSVANSRVLVLMSRNSIVGFGLD